MKQTRPPKMWLAPLNLHQNDKKILLSPTTWLSDIYYSQCCLATVKRTVFVQLHGGLQDVSLGLTMAFNILACKSIQILHTFQNHCMVTISIIEVQHPKVKCSIAFIIPSQPWQKHRFKFTVHRARKDRGLDNGYSDASI